MNNLVQIICGCAGAETIEECARVPSMLGATIIVVHGLWPQINYPGEDAVFGDTRRWLSPTSQPDNVQEIAESHGWHFIQLDHYAFNGEQYNVALDYIRANEIPCDHIWFVDSDECIDPARIPLLLAEVAQAKELGASQLRFQHRTEIVPGWKGFSYNVAQGNFGIVWGKALQLQRETYFDGNFTFKGDVVFAGSSIPLLHLHHFRKNAADRIIDGCWIGGGMKVNLETDTTPLEDTDYIQHLKTRYATFYLERGGKYSSYIGNDIYED